MVGGTVIDHVVLPDKVWVNCEDRGDTCAIYVERTDKSRTISEGDCVWWQGSWAMWTPAQNRLPSAESERRGNKCGVHFDIQLKRLGYSGVGRPAEVAR